MYRNLSPGAIGIRGLSLPETIDLARQTGFAGIDFSIAEAAQLADEQGIDHESGCVLSNNQIFTYRLPKFIDGIHCFITGSNGPHQF